MLWKSTSVNCVAADRRNDPRLVSANYINNSCKQCMFLAVIIKWSP